MQRIAQVGTGSFKSITLAGALAVSALLIGAGKAQAAVFAPITADNVPVADLTSVFDSSNAGNSYSLGAGSSYIPAGFDTRDLFGGSYGTFGPEQHDVIFGNNSPIGTVDTVNVTLGAAVSLNSFNLYLEDDGPTGDRSAREFLLFADGTLIDDVPILDTTGTQSYDSMYGSNYLQISDTLTGLPAATDYTLELVQNRDANGTSGVRALEFTATGTAGGAAVPEPASLAGVLISGIALLNRRRRA